MQRIDVDTPAFSAIGPGYYEIVSVLAAVLWYLDGASRAKRWGSDKRYVPLLLSRAERISGREAVWSLSEIAANLVC
jgi:hypothetical protein